MSWKPKGRHHKSAKSKSSGGLSIMAVGSRRFPRRGMTPGHSPSTQGWGAGAVETGGWPCRNQHIKRRCRQLAPTDRMQTLTIGRGVEEPVTEGNRKVTEPHMEPQLRA